MVIVKKLISLENGTQLDAGCARRFSQTKSVFISVHLRPKRYLAAILKDGKLTLFTVQEVECYA